MEFDNCKNLGDVDCMKSLGWNYKKVTIEYVKRILNKATAKAFINARDKFYLKYTDGDSVYFFSSPPKTWENSMGCEGYVIVRRGSLVAEILTLMN